MVGVPNSFQTKEDYTNAVDYAIANHKGIGVMVSELENLKNDVYINVLKESSAGKPAEEQTADDYERAENPACKKIAIGMSDEEIDALLVRLRSEKIGGTND